MWLISIVALLIGWSAAQAHEMGKDFDDWEDVNVVGDFRLLDQNGVSHALSYYSNYRYVLLVAGRTDCLSLPPEIREPVIKAEAAGRVKMFFLDPLAGETRAAVSSALQREGLSERSVLMDDSQMIARSFHFTHGGQFTLLDPKTMSTVAEGDIGDGSCLNAWLGDVEKGSASQCSLVGWPKVKARVSETLHLSRCDLQDGARANVTYTKDIQRIVATRCLRCHVDDSFGDFTDFTKVSGWSAMIRQVLRTQRMPPNGRDGATGGYVEDLTPSETRLLGDWLDNGSPRGEGRDLLPEAAARFQRVHADDSTGLLTQPPDLVFTQKKEHVIPAAGLLEYQYENLGGPLDHDVYVRALRINVNGRVVHHANLLLLDKPFTKDSRVLVADGMRKVPKYDRVIAAGDDERGKFRMIEEAIMLTSRKDDNSPTILPPGLAFKIPKGKYLVIEYHYTPDGRVEHNRAKVDVYTYKDSEIASLRTIRRMNFARARSGFTIPAGAKDFRVHTSGTLDRDITVLAFLPHFHFRGRSVTYSALLPNGEKRVLLSVPYFQMKFQPSHILAQGIYLPRGTVLSVDVIYDNSKENAQNPDASRVVPLGSQTYTDEMHQARIFFVEGAYKGGIQKSSSTQVLEEIFNQLAQRDKNENGD